MGALAQKDCPELIYQHPEAINPLNEANPNEWDAARRYHRIPWDRTEYSVVFPDKLSGGELQRFVWRCLCLRERTFVGR